MKYFKQLLSVFLITIFFSCTEEVDFSQAENIVLKPVYSLSLVNFTFNPNKFLDPLTGNEIPDLPADVTNFTVIKDENIKKYLQKINFNIEIKNELNKAFIIKADLLDETGAITHSFSDVNVPALELDFKYNEEIEISSNYNVLNTSQVRVKVDLIPSPSPLSPTDLSEFQFQSSVDLYIETK